MRAAVVAVLLLAACTVAPVATAPPATPGDAPTTAVAATPTPRPTAPPTPTPAPTASPNTVYTADDTAIAKLIRAGADEAIPQLKVLNDMDPSKLTDLFRPLGDWIADQQAGIAAHTPSTCTTAAAALFLKGLDQYDTIRGQFLAWRDWGAHGHAFPVGAPREAVATFDEAMVELEAHCPG